MAQAEGIAMQCDAFVKDTDGTWNAERDVPIPDMGRKLVIRQGSALRPGAAILGVDFAALLDQQCPGVQTPAPTPGSAPESTPATATATANVGLATYADANGFIDVQKLTCGQLASTSPHDAEFLGALYIGWYNGLAKKKTINVTLVNDVIRNLIAHCRANKDKRVTQAIDAIRREERR